jgi:DNA-binding HxlR family transcriptional regulator
MTVEYDLTEYGSKLRKIFDSFRVFIENNLEVFLEAERLYDTPEQAEHSRVTKHPRVGRRRVEKGGG